MRGVDLCLSLVNIHLGVVSREFGWFVNVRVGVCETTEWLKGLCEWLMLEQWPVEP